MLEKISTARGILFIFVLVGGVWYTLTKFSPDHTWRTGFTIGFAFLLCGFLCGHCLILYSVFMKRAAV